MSSHWRLRAVLSVALVVSLACGGCFLDTEVEPFYGRINVPRAQEFRWSDGGLPQTFDPALAAAPPDTDAVRALFEGLTEYDPQTLKPVPGVAARWESSADGREWIFHLRRDARWSNGEAVTARDFVHSWQRTLQLGDRAPHAKLLGNIVGAGPVVASASPKPTQEPQPQPPRQDDKKASRQEVKKEEKPSSTALAAPPPFGVEAVDDYTLHVRLQRADVNFPALVAHPVFRPVHDANSTLLNPIPAARVVSNGAFQLSKTGGDGVVLERAGNYWDAQAVGLLRVKFVPVPDAEGALAAYRAGDVDAVTNAGFEPLAVKLLAPYKDFRRATYGALTYYSFNTSHAPFDDARVRQALAISIDRERICEDEMGGATEPAKRFLPVQEQSDESVPTSKPTTLEYDVARAQGLLAAAGYPQGKGFPRVRLLVNRNDPQRLVAQSIAAMWRGALGIETDVITKNWEEYEADIRAGEYDVVRRGVVMQTTDEMTNMRVMFEPEAQTSNAATVAPENSEPPKEVGSNTAPGGAQIRKQETEERQIVERPAPSPQISTEEQALKELPAIPIYFASSYTLVKPYIVGFESNLLDAPSLKRVRIETTWQQPPKPATITWFK